MINIKDFGLILIKIDNTSCKNTGIYNITSQWKNWWLWKGKSIINPLYLIIGKAKGYIKESNGNKNLVFNFTDGNKKVLAKLTKLWMKLNTLLRQ